MIAKTLSWNTEMLKDPLDIVLLFFYESQNGLPIVLRDILRFAQPWMSHMVWLWLFRLILWIFNLSSPFFDALIPFSQFISFLIKWHFLIFLVNPVPVWTWVSRSIWATRFHMKAFLCGHIWIQQACIDDQLLV